MPPEILCHRMSHNKQVGLHFPSSAFRGAPADTLSTGFTFSLLFHSPRPPPFPFFLFPFFLFLLSFPFSLFSFPFPFYHFLHCFLFPFFYAYLSFPLSPFSFTSHPPLFPSFLLFSFSFSPSFPSIHSLSSAFSLTPFSSTPLHHHNPRASGAWPRACLLTSRRGNVCEALAIPAGRPSLAQTSGENTRVRKCVSQRRFIGALFSHEVCGISSDRPRPHTRYRSTSLRV